MNCKNCEDYGIVLKRSVQNNCKYAFRCSCPNGRSWMNYPMEPPRGYLPWLDIGECREAQEKFKRGELKLVTPAFVAGDAFEGDL